MPSWVTELALILAWPLAIAVSWTLGDVFGSWVWIAFWLMGLLGWGFFCLGGFARSDPVGFASIMAPPIALAGVALSVLAVGGKAGTIILASLAWELVWTLACSRIWPWWSRNILRRYRPGSPEAELLSEWGPITRLWRSATTTEDAKALWGRLLGLQRLETERTRPVIDGVFALWELSTIPGTKRSTFERASARLREEWARLWEAPRVRLPMRRPHDPFERPTRGTRLEFLFPNLEALVAVASREQQRQIAAESARLAIRDAGLMTPSLEKALDQAAVGPPDTRVREEIVARLQAVRERRDEVSDRQDVHDDRDWRNLAREAIALSAVSASLVDDMPSLAVADVVFESIRSEFDAGRASAYEELIGGIVGPVAAAHAVEIQPVVTSSNEASARSSPNRRDADISILGLQSGTGAGLVRLAVVGLCAGLVGTILRQLASPIYAGRPDAFAIDRAAGQIIIALVAYALVRAWFGRPSFFDIVVLFTGSFLSIAMVGPLFDLTSTLVARFADPAWTDFFADPDSVVLHAPFHGLTFAATLVVGSLLLSARDLGEPAQS